MRAQRLLVLVIFVAIAATACGSSSKGTASNTNPTTATNAPGGSSGGASGTTTTIKISGDSGSSFCDLARKDENTVFKNASLNSDTPADLKKLYENVVPAITEIESKSPDALKGDFQTFGTAYSTMVKALQDANYDVTKLSATTFAGLGTPQVKAASDHIQAYLTQVCHVTPTT